MPPTVHNAPKLFRSLIVLRALLAPKGLKLLRLPKWLIVHNTIRLPKWLKVLQAP